MTKTRYGTWVRGVLSALCALAGALPASAGSRQIADDGAMLRAQPSAQHAEQLLAVHNAERARLGLQPLRWNGALAADAASYARTLLLRGELAHAPAQERPGQGENLWMGTAGAWKADAMVQMFLDEKKHFRPASFPHVSLTGDWADVGHYTQIVWRSTQEVGCAIESGQGNDVLVCRYFPAGNVIGQAAY